MNHSFETDAGALPVAAQLVTPPGSAATRPSLDERCACAVRTWWQRLWMDDCTAYLSRATDCADLERRIRSWDEAARRNHMPLV